VEGWIRRSLLHREVQPAPWTLIAAAAIIVAVCYANSLPNDFILDDYQIVAVNPVIRNVAPLQVLSAPYWGDKSDSGIYRPLTILSFALEYPLWHRWAGGYRLTNLLLHTINGLLIFWLARSLLQSQAAACAAGAIYLAHPVHTEPVVGLAGRGELLAATFFLLAWLFFRQKRTVLCAFAFFLSLLSKENAIAFPAVMVLETLISQEEWSSFKAQWKRYAAVFGVALLYLGIRLWVLGGVAVPKFAQYLNGTLTTAQRELTSGRAFLKYFQLLIAPVDVTGDYDFNSIPIATAGDWVAWTGLLLVIVTMIFGLRMLRTRPALGFAILFFYATMLPVSNWIAPTSIVMSERALYLPSLGVCLIAGMLWAKLRNREVRRALAVGVMITAALLCVAHNYVWRNDLTYYGNMVRVLPDNIRGRQGYGVALVEAGRPDKAVQQFQAGLAIRRSAPLLVGLSEALIQIDGRCQRARPFLQEARTTDPTDPFIPWLVAGCLEKEGLLQEAEASYREAISRTEFPDPKLLADWGRVLEKTGRPREAREAYNRAALLK
jgi:Flp pilus assembly protein TadD